MRKVGLDTNFFMAIFLAEEDKIDSSAEIMEMITNGDLIGIVSTITLIEIATLFCQRQEPQKAKKAVELVTSLPNTIFVDVSKEMSLVSAELKVSEKLSIADAIILSAAIELSADIFLTFDSDFDKVARIKCITPQEFLRVTA
jgi:predicted nucleic acid-binding protein